MTSPSPSASFNDSPTNSQSHQARRLQLRNVGFRGPTIPSRRISPLFGDSPVSIEPCMRTGNKENTPWLPEHRAAPPLGEATPAGNILQEIQNSASKRKLSGRPASVTALQDCGADSIFGAGSETTWDDEANNNCSLVGSGSSPSASKPRETSGNQQASRQYSPITVHTSRYRVTRARTRTPSLGASRHIEFLERELALAKSAIDNDFSPEANKERNARLRALSTENRNLRQELEEWEKKYNDQVQEMIEKRLQFEAETKERLEALDIESEVKDARIRELEWECASVKRKARDVESLEVVNADLEKRIVVLTNMLAESPITDYDSSVSSPVRPRWSRRSSRHQSSLAKLPFSPSSHRFSLASVCETGVSQHQFPDSTTHSREFTDSYGDMVTSPESSDEFMSPTPLSLQIRHGNPRATATTHSTPSTSRPTSFVSPFPLGAFGWDTSLDVEDEAKAAAKKRRMRKFISGSKGLKPLVLPTASDRQTMPALATFQPCYGDEVGNRQSDTAPSPAPVFLSGLQATSPTLTPTLPLHRQSTLEAHDQAFLALQGKSSRSDVSESSNTMREQAWDTKICREDGGDTFDAMLKTCGSLRSLEVELEQAEAEEEEGPVVACDVAGLSFERRAASQTPEATLEIPQPEIQKLVIGLEPPSSESSASGLSHPQGPVDEASGLISRMKSRSPEASSFQSSPKPGIATRLTNLLSHKEQIATMSVRQLLANAWSLGSGSLMGGLCWWLIGPAYHWRRHSLGSVGGHTGPSNTQDKEQRRPLLRSKRGSTTLETYYSMAKGDLGAVRQRIANHGSTWASTRYNFYVDPEMQAPLPATKEYAKIPLPICNECVEPSTRRSLRLWFQFSITLVLAVGMAVKHGPGALLQEPLNGKQTSHEEHSRSAASVIDESTSTDCHKISERSWERDNSSGTSKTEISKPDSGYASSFLHETSVPASFEDTC